MFVYRNRLTQSDKNTFPCMHLTTHSVVHRHTQIHDAASYTHMHAAYKSYYTNTHKHPHATKHFMSQAFLLKTNLPFHVCFRTFLTFFSLCLKGSLVGFCKIKERANLAFRPIITSFRNFMGPQWYSCLCAYE